MTHTKVLRQMFQNVQVTGEFGEKAAKAVLTILIDMSERLDRVERVLENKHPG